MHNHVDMGDGNSLFLRDWGAGPPVLFLAGWAMDSRIWGETMIRLNRKGLRAIAYDRRGHGRSSEWGSYDYDTLAGDLETVVETLGLHELTIISHSGAAGEVLRYCSATGARCIRQLIMVGATGPAMMDSPGNPGVTPEELDFLVSRLATDLDGWIDENLAPFAPGVSRRTNDWLASMVLDCSRRAIVEFQDTIARADLTVDASTLTMPVTLIHGDLDVSTPLEMTARRYAEIIPAAELIVYSGAAHGLMLTHGERLASDILKTVSA